MALRFPGRVALGLDARDSMVATAGWLDVSQNPAIDLARRFVGLPLGAVIYTNIANDGMMKGVDPATFSANATKAGTVQLWEWIGDEGATTFSF